MIIFVFSIDVGRSRLQRKQDVVNGGGSSGEGSGGGGGSTNNISAPAQAHTGDNAHAHARKRMRTHTAPHRFPNDDVGGGNGGGRRHIAISRDRDPWWRPRKNITDITDIIIMDRFTF